MQSVRKFLRKVANKQTNNDGGKNQVTGTLKCTQWAACFPLKIAHSHGEI